MKALTHLHRIAITTCLSLLSGAASAHTGHGTSGLFEGLTHPFGLDHLLAMVAVGLWSVTALSPQRAWWGPATFMTSLVISALLGTMGVTIPFLENLISLSVVLFGAMLVLSRFKISHMFGLGLISVAAAMHGLAHGAESPEAGFLAYAIGFLITTATLHFGGVVVGLGIKRFIPARESLVATTLGLLLGGAGIYLFSQL